MSSYPEKGICGCCGRWCAATDWDGLYGACVACAFCQSLGHCYEGADVPENTICCHGLRDELCFDRSRMKRCD